MTTVAATPQEQQLLDVILHRLDRLDTAVQPAVAGILTAAERLPPADRLHDLGAPVVHEWARTLNDRRHGRNDVEK